MGRPRIQLRLGRTSGQDSPRRVRGSFTACCRRHASSRYVSSVLKFWTGLAPGDSARSESLNVAGAEPDSCALSLAVELAWSGTQRKQAENKTSSLSCAVGFETTFVQTEQIQLKVNQLICYRPLPARPSVQLFSSLLFLTYAHRALLLNL